MSGSTPHLQIPYPTGTDRVADGDNAIQALAERIEARMPWGAKGRVQSTATTAHDQNGQTVPGLALTLSLLSTRLYRATFAGSVGNGGAGSRPSLMILLDGTGIHEWVLDMNANTYAGFVNTVTFTATSGSHTIQGYGRASGGTTFNTVGSAANPLDLVVDDIGPWPLLP